MTDYLSRQPYIDLLKSVIINQCENPSGYSFSIDGDWGCGKTWILTELEQQLIEDKEYLIFHYNAWENDYYKEPLIAILSVMIEKLNEITKQKSLYESAIDELIKEALNDLKLLICGPFHEVTKIDLEKSIEHKKGLFKRIKQGTKISSKEIDSFLPLQNALKTVRENIKKLSVKLHIILVIDELDRCLPEYAIKVLERLHHICNEMPVIQILAINKRDLSFGIAKIYGVNNSEIDPYKFADKYLQKFIQLSIPLNNGIISDDETILNKIDEGFSPAIAIDKASLIDFYKSLMTGITPRTQEHICKQVALAHKLTVLSGHKLDSYSYGLLCCELLYCIKYLIFRTYTDFIIEHEDGSIYSLKSNIINNKCEIISLSQFENNLEKIFRKEYQSHEEDFPSPRGGYKQLSGFSCENTSSQLMNYFVNTYLISIKWPQVITMDNVIKPEREFLKYFKTTLQRF
ncbi:MAG: NTPase KAP [Treponema sp.]|nr:NTPase KAP [Treponema sp.]